MTLSENNIFYLAFDRKQMKFLSLILTQEAQWQVSKLHSANFSPDGEAFVTASSSILEDISLCAL